MKWKPPRGFKEIPLTKGDYFISRKGEVYSRPRSNSRGGIIVQFNDLNGYPTMSLRFDGRWVTKRVHTLVALTYLPNPTNYKAINHKNGVKNDNRVANLEWCDTSYNNYHCVRVLGRVGAKRKLTEAQIKEIHSYSKSIVELAKLYNVSERCISNVRAHKSYREIIKKLGIKRKNNHKWKLRQLKKI